MINFVINGGIWNENELKRYAESRNFKVSPLIQISRFEDNLSYIHDGHHRVYSVYKGNRKYLYSDEYVIVNWKYNDYLEINLEAGWFTPFDPRTHCRIPDLSPFKKIIRNSLHLGKEYIINFVQNNNNYLERRKFKHIGEMHV